MYIRVYDENVYFLINEYYFSLFQYKSGVNSVRVGDFIILRVNNSILRKYCGRLLWFLELSYSYSKQYFINMYSRGLLLMLK